MSTPSVYYPAVVIFVAVAPGLYIIYKAHAVFPTTVHTNWQKKQTELLLMALSSSLSLPGSFPIQYHYLRSFAVSVHPSSPFSLSFPTDSFFSTIWKLLWRFCKSPSQISSQSSLDPFIAFDSTATCTPLKSLSSLGFATRSSLWVPLCHWLLLLSHWLPQSLRSGN